MGCVVEVVTKLRSGIEDREIARKKMVLDADEVAMPKLCRELKYKLNISGVHTRLKHPTETNPWFVIITAKSAPTFFEWRILTGEEADIVTNEFHSKEWRGMRGYANGKT
jgi:hypothetical protein